MSKTMKVMLVDDEFLVREHLKRIVNWESLGYEIIHESSDGEAAVEVVKADLYVPDVIFMDICMPVIDGIEAARRIKLINENIQVVMLTGHDDFDYARKSIRLGAFDYLSKPINPTEIKEVLGKIKEKRAKVSERETEIITEALGKTVEKDSNDLKSQCSETVIKVIELVDAHLSNSELSFAHVCEVLFISKSYLSRKFKQETGMNFNTYLLDCRIKKAMELIQNTSLKNYEIADKIGIEDPNYFSYVFKNHMKISISEYRKSQMSNKSKILDNRLHS